MSKPETDECGLGPALLTIAGKWRPTIIWSLHAEGPLRFGQLRRQVSGISEKILFEELRALESADIVHREAFDERPARVEYSLTPAGSELNEAVHALAEWGKRHRAKESEKRCLELVREQPSAA